MTLTSSYPKLGETRCYWTLLDANLRFVFTDPVLTYHLKEQAGDLIGRTLQEFIHPDERESASKDLALVIQQQAIHGTVTRVKYLRLSQIRVVLGATVKDTFPHAAQVGYDKDYLPCDLVLNWVADNLALCFVHAIIDISPVDNDELFKAQWHWTNWCSTVPFSPEESALLRSRLFDANLIKPPIQPPPEGNVLSSRVVSGGDSSHARDVTSSASYRRLPAPRRVFQILANSPARKTLFSWPPEAASNYEYEAYDTEAFGKLASNVRIDSPIQSASGSPASSSGSTSFAAVSSPQLGAHSLAQLHPQLHSQSGESGGGRAGIENAAGSRHRQHDPDSPYAEVRTSCTRRYKSLQTVLSRSDSRSPPSSRIDSGPGVAYEVESIFIPHGGVIFACHQVLSEHAIPSISFPVQPHQFPSSLQSFHSGASSRPASQPWTLKHNPTPRLSPSVESGPPSESSSSRLQANSNALMGVTSTSITPPASQFFTHAPDPNRPPSAEPQFNNGGSDRQHWFDWPASSSTSTHESNRQHSHSHNGGYHQHPSQLPAISAAFGEPAPSAYSSAAFFATNGDQNNAAHATSRHSHLHSQNAHQQQSHISLPSLNSIAGHNAGGGAFGFDSGRELQNQHPNQLPNFNSFSSPQSQPHGHSDHSAPPTASLTLSSTSQYSTVPSMESHHHPANGHVRNNLSLEPLGISSHYDYDDSSLHQHHYPQPHTDSHLHSLSSSSLPLPGRRPSATASAFAAYVASNSNHSPSSAGSSMFTPSSFSSNLSNENLSSSMANSIPMMEHGPNKSPASPLVVRSYGSYSTANLAKGGGSKKNRAAPVTTGQGASGVPSSSSSTRVSGNPPAGVTQCAFCGTTSSPEWRKGVTGIKNLCNACGLRYARTKQKEEGHVPTRRRMLTSADIQSSAGSITPSDSSNPHSQFSNQLPPLRHQQSEDSFDSFNSNRKRLLSMDESHLIGGDLRRRQPSPSPPYATSSPSDSPTGIGSDNSSGRPLPPLASAYGYQRSNEYPSSHTQYRTPAVPD